MGPHLDLHRIQQLPDHFGPGRASSVLQQCVQACVDSAHNQGTVFSCLKSGQGGEVISGGGSFEHSSPLGSPHEMAFEEEVALLYILYCDIMGSYKL